MRVYVTSGSVVNSVAISASLFCIVMTCDLALPPATLASFQTALSHLPAPSSVAHRMMCAQALHC